MLYHTSRPCSRRESRSWKSHSGYCRQTRRLPPESRAAKAMCSVLVMGWSVVIYHSSSTGSVCRRWCSSAFRGFWGSRVRPQHWTPAGEAEKIRFPHTGQTGMDGGTHRPPGHSRPGMPQERENSMVIGFRAYKEFERPAPELVEAFRGIPSSNIGDCTQRMNCMFDGIRPFNDLPLVGTAFTVRVPSGDNLVAQAALDYARPGDIIVIDAAGNTDRGMVGGMMLAYAEMRGLGGFVVNGAVRDLEDIQNGSLPVYGKAVSPLGPYRQGPGEMNVPVVCGGQVVMPGDILVGDRDGIVVIPRQEAAELLEAARKNLQDEQEAMARMKAGTFPVEEHLESFTGSLLRHGGELI